MCTGKVRRHVSHRVPGIKLCLWKWSRPSPRSRWVTMTSTLCAPHPCHREFGKRRQNKCRTRHVTPVWGNGTLGFFNRLITQNAVHKSVFPREMVDQCARCHGTCVGVPTEKVPSNGNTTLESSRWSRICESQVSVPAMDRQVCFASFQRKARRCLTMCFCYHQNGLEHQCNLAHTFSAWTRSRDPLCNF